MLDLQQVRLAISSLIDLTDAKIIAGFRGGLLSVKDKGGRVETNPVTEVDGAVEDLLKERLLKEFPDIGFVGEEHENVIKEEYNWVVDPIDGTHNFSLKIPVFATSVALWQKNEPIYGVMSFPMQDLRVEVIKDQGIWVNGVKQDDYDEAGKFSKTPVIMFGMVGANHLKTEIITKIAEQYALPRYVGSAVYHLMMVGLGKADAAAFWNLAPWDLGLAKLLMKETGLEYQEVGEGLNLDFNGKDPYRFKLVLGKQPYVKSVAGIFSELLDD